MNKIQAFVRSRATGEHVDFSNQENFGLKDNLSKAGNAIRNVAGQAKDLAGKVPGKAGDLVNKDKGLAQSAGKGIADKAGQVGKFAGENASKAKGALQSGAGKVAELARNNPKAVKGAAIGAGILAAGAGAYALGKHLSNKADKVEADKFYLVEDNEGDLDLVTKKSYSTRQEANAGKSEVHTMGNDVIHVKSGKALVEADPKKFTLG